MKDWGNERWVGLSVVCIPMPRSSLPLLRSSLGARSVVKRLLGKPTKEYSDGKH